MNRAVSFIASCGAFFLFGCCCMPEPSGKPQYAPQQIAESDADIPAHLRPPASVAVNPVQATLNRELAAVQAVIRSQHRLIFELERKITKGGGEIRLEEFSYAAIGEPYRVAGHPDVPNLLAAAAVVVDKQRRLIEALEKELARRGAF
jgi:hypothetical protein